jgi:hypothetical protein
VWCPRIPTSFTVHTDSAALRHVGDVAHYVVQVEWNESTLRFMLRQMLARFQLGALDLIKAWDGNGDGVLSEDEYLTHLSHFFRGYDRLWCDEIVPTPRAHTVHAPMHSPLQSCTLLSVA